MQKSLDEVIARSTNFGYLIDYEPLLAYAGASAEARVYTDPEGSMLRSRQFVETMTRKAIIVLAVDSQTVSLYGRIDDLHRAGVLVPWVRQAFHYVRMTGNRVVHGNRCGTVLTALTAVRDCFDLGLWLHNVLTGGEDIRAYVPPQPPESLLWPKSDDDREAGHLRAKLEVYQRRLAEEIDHGGAAGPFWIRTAAVASAMGQMAAEKSNGDAVRSLDQELERRAHEIAAGLDDRLDRVRARSAARCAELRDNALRAGRAGNAELHQLSEIAREISERDDGGAGERVLAHAVAKGGTDFVRGTVYGGSTRLNRTGSWRA